MISGLMIPMFFFYLAFVVAHGAFGDEFLKKTADFIKGIWLWLLKLLIIVFSTYMSVTGVVSGTTDQTALKAAKIVISSAVPVIGGILSDSSEAVLVSMGVLKNAAGIYGMLAVLSVFMGPFIKIMMNYLGIKVSALLCSIFGEKRISSLTEGFATAMSLLLAMTATACMFVLISTVCFLKGAG
jgi:stage III sporulation protein AE